MSIDEALFNLAALVGQHEAYRAYGAAVAKAQTLPTSTCGYVVFALEQSLAVIMRGETLAPTDEGLVSQWASEVLRHVIPSAQCTASSTPSSPSRS